MLSPVGPSLRLWEPRPRFMLLQATGTKIGGGGGGRTARRVLKSLTEGRDVMAQPGPSLLAGSWETPGGQSPPCDGSSMAESSFQTPTYQLEKRRCRFLKHPGPQNQSPLDKSQIYRQVGCRVAEGAEVWVTTPPFCRVIVTSETCWSPCPHWASAGV